MAPLTLPIFDAGRLRANLRGKTAELDAAVESYNALVIDAVRDVADQLTSAQAIQKQQAAKGPRAGFVATRAQSHPEIKVRPRIGRPLCHRIRPDRLLAAVIQISRPRPHRTRARDPEPQP